MARINIEQCWWSDPRRSKLIRLVGGDARIADGLAAAAWRLAQEYWKHNRQLIPLNHFECIDDYQALIEAKLVEVRPEGVYVRGSCQYLEWVKEQREIASAAGKISAQRPRDEKGRLLPKAEQPEAKSNEAPTISNELHLSVSGSNTNTNTNTLAPRKRGASEQSALFDLKELYKGYPRKRGKERGLEKLAKDVKTEQDYTDLSSAIRNYNQEVIGRDPKHMLYFSTFANQWRDWVEIEPNQENFSINVTPLRLESVS